MPSELLLPEQKATLLPGRLRIPGISLKCHLRGVKIINASDFERKQSKLAYSKAVVASYCR